jgi:hypothetical protein
LRNFVSALAAQRSSIFSELSTLLNAGELRDRDYDTIVPQRTARSQIAESVPFSIVRGISLCQAN